MGRAFSDLFYNFFMSTKLIDQPTRNSEPGIWRLVRKGNPGKEGVKTKINSTHVFLLRNPVHGERDDACLKIIPAMNRPKSPQNPASALLEPSAAPVTGGGLWASPRLLVERSTKTRRNKNKKTSIESERNGLLV